MAQNGLFLVSVDFDPFAEEAAGASRLPLVPVDFDPFADEPSAVSRGFVSGLLKQNPELLAETLEGLSHLAPEQFRESFASASADLQSIAESSPEEFAPKARSLFDSGTLDEALTSLGESFGQGLASTVPSLITGTVGGVAGQRVAGKPGGVVGAVTGASIPSAGLNFGEVYKALKAEGVAAEEAAGWAAFAVGPMTALDVVSLGPIIARLGGFQVRQALARNIARRVAAEAAKGAGREGITEAIQETIKDATVSLASGKPFFTVETLKGAGEAGVTGLMVGGALGGAAGVRGDRTTPQGERERAAAAATGPGDPEFERTAQEIAVESLTPQQRPVPPGERERAAVAPASVSPADEASPIPTDIIAEGRAAVQGAEATGTANDILRRNGLPAVGARVTVTLPDGETAPGEVADAFTETNAELGLAEDGIKIALDGGGTFEQFVTDLGQRGIAITPEAPGVPSIDDLLPAADVPRETIPLPEGVPTEGTGERDSPVIAETAAEVDVAAAQADTEPSDAQKEAGNYKKGHVRFQDFDITIETPRGATRTGVSPEGVPWSVVLPAHYGYIKGTEGADQEQVDVYLGEDDRSQIAFVVDQIDPATGNFDEHKVILGASDIQGAENLYDAGFNDGSGPARRGAVTGMPLDEFKEWVERRFASQALAYEAPGTPAQAQEPVPRTPTAPEAEIATTAILSAPQTEKEATDDDTQGGRPLRSAREEAQEPGDVSDEGGRRAEAGGGGVLQAPGPEAPGGRVLGAPPAAGPGVAESPSGVTRPGLADSREPTLRGQAEGPAQREGPSQPDLLSGPEIVESEQLANERADAIIDEAREAGLSDQEIHDQLADLAEGEPAGGLDLPASSELFGDLAAIRRVDERLEQQRASELSKQDRLKAKVREKRAEGSIGINRDGDPIFEDEAGVRSVSRGGIRRTEPVAIVPTRGGGVQAARRPRGQRTDEFKTVEELAPEAPTPAVPVSDTVTPAEATQLFEETNRRLPKGYRISQQVGTDTLQLSRPVGDPIPWTSDFRSLSKAQLSGELDRIIIEARRRSDAGVDTAEKATTKASEKPILEAQEQADDEFQPSVPTGDERAGAGDVQPAAPDRGAARAPQGEIGGGAPAVRRAREGQAEAAERPGAQRVRPAADRGTGVRDVSGLPSGRDQPRGRPARDEPRRDPDKGDNLSIAKNGLNEGRGPVHKARDNIRVIELVRQIEAEGRPATKAEQDELALYVGWGGLKGVFPDSEGGFAQGFKEVGERLRELLADTEYSTARRSIQYAHYTSETIVRGMWTAAERLGFHGGRVFEPGMGIGNFAGFMPGDLAGKVDYSGLELDHITTRIARLLYPQHGVRRDDFTRSPLPADTYDLAIGNPPFGDISIQSDPAYKQDFLLHDYFFVKSLDGVRPGGLMMFISSAGTLNKADAKARNYMADRADFVAAIRLPSNTFKQNAGTEVTTDIIILRKRLPGEQEGSRDWVDTVEITLPDREGNPKTGLVNKWIADNPDAVLGEQGFFDKLFPGRYGVRAIKGADLANQIAERIEALPSEIMSEWLDTTERAEIDFGTAERKEGSFYIKDGQLYQLTGGVGRPVQRRTKGVTGGKTAAAIERITALIPIRDALRATYAADLNDDTENGDRARKRLNASYDAFVGKYGPINKANVSHRRPSVVQQESARAEAREEARITGALFFEGSFDATDMLRAGASMQQAAAARKEAREAVRAIADDFDEGTFKPAEMPDLVLTKGPNIDPFMDDQEGYRMRAIEAYDPETGESSKRPVFFENVITRETTPEINSLNDAVLFVLNQTGRLDIEAVARAADKTATEVIEGLGESIFLLPGTQDTWVTRDEYLSGDVRKKLQQALEAAKRNDAFQRNADALEAAQPPPLSPAEIKVNLGMPWIPTETIELFGTEALGLSSLSVGYTPKLALWTVAGDDNSAAAVTTWGTVDMPAPKLISSALNRQTPRVTRTEIIDGNRRQVLDPAATEAATAKMQEIRDRFSDWLWENPERATVHADFYNAEYNNLIAREFNGDYLTTPGVATSWTWRSHQRRVVARIIQDGNTYMAHAVGAGKTSAMIGAGMEMRRLGLVRKPMYAVPNHMLGQFTKEFYEQYPTARIAVADERRFHTGRRKQFMADVANTDLDAIIITHSSFGLIPVSHDFQDGLIQNELTEFRNILDEIGRDPDQRFTRRQIENAIERLEQRLSGRTTGARDQVFTFEEMGVDFLFMDEAHEFRKLDFATKMSSMKGIDPAGSGKAWDLFVKTRYLETINPGRNLVLASGTPVTNTMAELFTVSRYIQQDELDSRGLGHFDAWAGAFGETSTEIEQNAAGGYKQATRFANFVNIPELSTMVRQRMDVITSEQLTEFVTRPTLKGGKREMHLAERTDELISYQRALEARMRAIQERTGPPQRGDDILLNVIGDGRKAAIDMRLVGPQFPNDPGSKLNLLVDQVFQIWQDTKRQPFHEVTEDGYSKKPVDTGPATQMVFANLGVSDRGPLNVHKYIRSELSHRGVPRAEIVLMSEHRNNQAARQRVFNDMNDSTVRVLIGSTQMMATGVNAQRHMIAVHNLDPLWYPSLDEQRNGRLVRQGNMNPEVQIHQYSTKGTYDSQMWGMMARKARFIEGFFRGDPFIRNMEDFGEASQFEQAKAITTADPRLIELAALKQKLERARRRKSSFESDQYAIANRVSGARGAIPRAEQRIVQIRADVAARTDTSGDNFTAVSNGKTFDDRVEFGDSLMEQIDKLKAAKKAKRAPSWGPSAASM